MNNVNIVPTWVMKEVGRRLINSLKFAGNVRRDLDDQYKVAGAKVGDTVKMRLPQRYQVSSGSALVVTPTEDRTVDIKLTDQKHVGLEYNMLTATLEQEMYRERYIEPATDALCNDMDLSGLQRCYKQVYWTVGSPGVMPGSTGTLPQACNLVYSGARVKLTKAAVPGPYYAVLEPDMQNYLVSANQATFNPQAAISDGWTNGKFSGRALGIDTWVEDQNVVPHTVGALGGTPLVNGASQTGASVITDGWTAAVATRLKRGDVVQFSGVYAVNPQSYQSTGQLQDFVVTADTASDGSGNLTIPISPSIITSGPFQTVTGSPANNAPVTIFGHASTYANAVSFQGLVYHKDAFACVMADLEMPEGGVAIKERISNKALNVALRFVKQYDIRSDSSPSRVDSLYGWNVPRPEMACRVCA